MDIVFLGMGIFAVILCIDIARHMLADEDCHHHHVDQFGECKHYEISNLWE